MAIIMSKSKDAQSFKVSSPSTSIRMLSPKMQRSIRIHDTQILNLFERARFDQHVAGYLYKRTSDNTKWQCRWFLLYQNLLFYAENEEANRPSGVIFLEGCYCERLITPPGSGPKGKDSDKQLSHCFAVTYRRENQRHYELMAETESDCKAWIDAIKQASFNKMLLQKEELEQKHLHLLQIVESEKTAKWQYTQQCEELTMEIKKLRTELCQLKREWKFLPNTKSRSASSSEEEPEEIRKIKKVQSFFRGWLCRRRWKQIVEEYIHSPHAESMRKRNSLVFRMVEAEEEYVRQLQTLISGFLRPFKMAACSRKPICTHEDVNSIFLNAETVFFLHQIFLKGLTARMENWPTLVLGDLFDMLLPMLSIYQEYVRNHHYSLQVITECKQNPEFAHFLDKLENKSGIQGRTLENFLTYPMHQIPRYIITLHELLAHTPYNHVERKSLENARNQLEELSRQMHDEVSETENIRKNLSIERMISEGCDILLDMNQVFVRQGTLLQLPKNKKSSSMRSLMGSFKSSEKDNVRQCFLFTNHLIIATRSSGGKLHLLDKIGKIGLTDATLIEDPPETCFYDEDGGSVNSSLSSLSSESSGPVHDNKETYHNLDFKIIVEQKSGPPITIHLMASTMQEKQAWVTDIGQCLDNVHFNNINLLTSSGGLRDGSSTAMSASAVKSDPRLFKDDVDIRFSRTLNSCKVPQIRYATPDRLLERLTDLRFLSVDFLNTFLLTYRVFTDGITVLEALKKVYNTQEPPELEQYPPVPVIAHHLPNVIFSRTSPAMSRQESFDSPLLDSRRSSSASRRTSATSDAYGNVDMVALTKGQHWRVSYRKWLAQAVPMIDETFPQQDPPSLSVTKLDQPLEEEQREGAGLHLIQETSKDEGDEPQVHPRPPERPRLPSIVPTSTTAGIRMPTPLAAAQEARALHERKKSEVEEKFLSIPKNQPVGNTSSSAENLASTSESSTTSVKTVVQMGASTSTLAGAPSVVTSDDTSSSSKSSPGGGSLTEMGSSKADVDENKLKTKSASALLVAVTSPKQPAGTARGSISGPQLLPHQQPSAERKPPPVLPRQSSIPQLQSGLRLPLEQSTMQPPVIPSRVNQPQITIPERPSSEKKETPAAGESTKEGSSKPQEAPSGQLQPQEPAIFARKPSLQTPQIIQPTSTNPFNPFHQPSQGQKLAPTIHRPHHQLKFEPANPEPASSSTVSKPIVKISDDSGSSSTNLLMSTLLSEHGSRRSSRETTVSLSRSRTGSGCLTGGFQTPKRGSYSSLMPSSASSIVQGPTHAPRRTLMSRDADTSHVGSGYVSSTARSSYICPDSPSHIPKVGVVITSSRQARRRSSSSTAAAAFAAATAASGNPRDVPTVPAGISLLTNSCPPSRRVSYQTTYSYSGGEESRRMSSRSSLGSSLGIGLGDYRRGSSKDGRDQLRLPRGSEGVLTATAATMRVLSVLRHWVSKHPQDFEQENLKNLTIEFLEDCVGAPNLLPAEHKAATQLLRLLSREDFHHKIIDLENLLTPPTIPVTFIEKGQAREPLDALSALEIAEEMTYLDHKIFVSIKSEELLGQAWMKSDKNNKAPHVVMITKRFNDVSRLVASEILSRPFMNERVSVIEKWTAVADICRCLHNFNGVLQICSAFTNSAIFRLKKTWDRVSRTTKQTLEKLQKLVSADGRFRNLRDALHRCDPPCIPYLGLYLTDLSFIEEGTPTFTEDNLINFSKMRMIAHVIREIRHFQQTPYKIEHNTRVSNYLLYMENALSEEELYQRSLTLEPRISRMSITPSSIAASNGQEQQDNPSPEPDAEQQTQQSGSTAT